MEDFQKKKPKGQQKLESIADMKVRTLSEVQFIYFWIQLETYNFSWALYEYSSESRSVWKLFEHQGSFSSQ